MPVSFFPSAPPCPPLSAPPPSRPASSSSHPPPVVITITDEDGFECALELPGPEPAIPAQGLLAAIRSAGFMQAMTDLVAPHLKPGSPGRNALDQFGLFNVTQAALLLPPHKFGVQVNIVKPDIYPHTGNYYLQLFPVHNEIGFDLVDTFIASGLKDYLPAWCGLGTQLIFNHGVEVPIVHMHEGWKMQADDSRYLEELVFRPSELALKYLGTPVQATLAVEVGMHLKWQLKDDNAKWAFATSFAANTFGAAAGFATACATGSDPMMMAHGGAMLGQLAMHGLQCGSKSLRPAAVATWAGFTFGAGDVNTGHFMDYPRVWWHGHEGNWDLRDLKPQAEHILGQFFARQRRNRAIELAEMGIDNTAYPHEMSLPSISANYAAQR
ncbi:MAG TPA: hypothetical protein VGN04_07615 [Herbaspirillum sp.]